MIGIYKITNPKGKVYVGQSTDLTRREYYYSHANCRKQPKILHSIKKYGWHKHKFEVIMECEISQLNELERYYQDVYCCLGNGGLNCHLTKASDRSGLFSEEVRQKISKAAMGRKRSAESIEKTRLKNIGKVRTESAKIQTVLTRRVNGTLKHTEETKKRLSEIGLKIGHLISARQIGKPRSEATKQKIREFRLNNPQVINAALLVVNLETGIYYMSIKSAAESIGMSADLLRSRLRGVTKNKTSIRYA